MNVDEAGKILCDWLSADEERMLELAGKPPDLITRVTRIKDSWTLLFLEGDIEVRHGAIIKTGDGAGVAVFDTGKGLIAAVLPERGRSVRKEDLREIIDRKLGEKLLGLVRSLVGKILCGRAELMEDTLDLFSEKVFLRLDRLTVGVPVSRDLPYALSVVGRADELGWTVIKRTLDWTFLEKLIFDEDRNTHYLEILKTAYVNAPEVLYWFTDIDAVSEKLRKLRRNPECSIYLRGYVYSPGMLSPLPFEKPDSLSTVFLLSFVGREWELHLENFQLHDLERLLLRYDLQKLKREASGLKRSIHLCYDLTGDNHILRAGMRQKDLGRHLPAAEEITRIIRELAG